MPITETLTATPTFELPGAVQEKIKQVFDSKRPTGLLIDLPKNALLALNYQSLEPTIQLLNQAAHELSVLLKIPPKEVTVLHLIDFYRQQNNSEIASPSQGK